MFSLDSVPQPNPHVVGQVVSDEAVLVIPGRGQVKVLNEIGARIWQLVDGKRSVARIASQIAAEYEVDLAECQRDCLSFLDELLAKGILIDLA